MKNGLLVQRTICSNCGEGCGIATRHARRPGPESINPIIP
jgi:hypothetical protein